MTKEKRKISKPLLIFIFIISLFVSGVFLFAWQDAKFTNADTKVKAVITSIEKVQSPNVQDGIRYDVTAEYLVKGTTYKAKYSYVTSSGEKVGDEIEILYDSSNPGDYYIGVHPSEDRPIFFWLFAFSLIIPIVIIFYFLKIKIKGKEESDKL